MNPNFERNVQNALHLDGQDSKVLVGVQIIPPHSYSQEIDCQWPLVDQEGTDKDSVRVRSANSDC